MNARSVVPVLDGDAGMALLHVVLLLTLLTALAAGAAMLARVDVLIARHHRDEREAAYAAQAMLAAAVQELDRVADWNAVLSGTQSATFAGGLPAAPSPAPAGGRRSWRAFGWQSLDRLFNLPAASSYRLVAWVADDEDDGDGNAGRDSNGRVLVLAEAIAPLGTRRSVEALLQRGPLDPVSGVYSPGLQMLTWREPSHQR